MRKDIEEREQQIREWVVENRSKAFICKELNCKPITLNSYLKKFSIDYSGNKGTKGFERPQTRKSALEYLQSPFVKSHILRQKLIEDGIRKYCCEICNNIEWNGVPIPLELHHVDGNHYNNTLENVQIICPNCHALTDTNSGKNKGTKTQA